MSRAVVIVLASLAIALGLAPPAVGQSEVPARTFLTKKGERPAGLFAPGVMVGKAVCGAGKGDYRPNADLGEKVRNCLDEIRKTLQVAGLDMKNVVKSFV